LMLPVHTKATTKLLCCYTSSTCNVTDWHYLIVIIRCYTPLYLQPIKQDDKKRCRSARQRTAWWISVLE